MLAVAKAGCFDRKKHLKASASLSRLEQGIQKR
jgi:hypothetical protein